MKYLLDTNVVSEPTRRRPDQGVLAWLAQAPSVELCTSALVVGEIRSGIEVVRSRDRERSVSFERWLERLLDEYSDRILPVTVPVAEAWGRLTAIRPLPFVDSVLVATAAVHGLTFVSREAASFADLGVPVVNPWATSA